MDRRKFLQMSGMATALVAKTFKPLKAETENSGIAADVRTAFKHPGIIQTHSQLETMKRMITTAQEPVATAWKRLTALPTASLDFTPKPVTHVFRSANGSSRSGADEFNESGQAAHAHALQWYVTGKAAHAEKAIHIIDTWSTTLWDFAGNDAKLLAGWTGAYFCEAAEILRCTYPAWKQQSRISFQHLLTRVLVPLLAPFFPEANGNWDGAIMFTVMAMAIYLDDGRLFDRAVQHYLYGPINSGILKYVWPSGQCEESCRDQAHVQLGLGYFSYAALVAWNQGVDLFAAGDNRLALGFEYTSRYMLGMEVPYFGVISSRARGHFSDFYEAAYQHYRFDRGMEMPVSTQAAERARSDSRAISAVWLFRGGPDGVNLAAPPNPDTHASDAGAHDQNPSPQPSWHRIEPGESIQAVIDSTEGTANIILAPGIHSLASPLKLRSDVTIIGFGGQTVLHLAPQSSDYALMQGSPTLERITLRNFTIEGALSTDWPTDPNQPRRERSAQMAPPRGGILLDGNSEGDIRNVVLEHLTIRNCVSNGIAISGATGITIAGCDVSESGGNNAPGQGLNHNILLNHVSDCRVRDCRSVSSLGGSGMSVKNSSRVTISECELSRNRGYGAEVSNCTHVKLERGLFEANDSGAYCFETDGKPSPPTILQITERLNGSSAQLRCC